MAAIHPPLARQRDELSEALVAAGHDYVELERLGRDLETVQADLAQAENRWLLLAEEAEAR